MTPRARSRIRPLALWVIVAILAAAAGCGDSASPPQAAARRTSNELASRRWIEFVQSLVRETKPAPTEAARAYAYVATAYGEVRRVASEAEASEAARRLAIALYPAREAAVSAFAAEVGTAPLSGPSTAVVTRLISRSSEDGYLNQEPVSPRLTGEGRWVGENPLTPGAGNWQRWIVGAKAFSVPEPIAYGSVAYAEDLQKVRDAVLRRDARWTEIINFWGGVPGTETPAGIWLNRLWAEVKDSGIEDAQYAEMQLILAQTLADAFIECWRVKYTYWTARPDMVDGTIATAMRNPNFPGYVSGHSTVSAAAATVLAKLVPASADRFAADARAARDSRLYAGIHFASDNDAGFQLGTDVGTEVVKKLGLG